MVEEISPELEELVSHQIDGRITPEQARRLNELLKNSPEAVKQYLELLDNHEALCAIYPGDVYINSFEESSLSERGKPIPARSFSVRPLLLATLVIGLGLTAWTLLSRPSGGPKSFVAEISAFSGSLIWTGDRGQIVRHLQVGSQLQGGTIEGLAPDSWAEIRFRDGSTVMVSGTSLLTFADDGQKILRLREGHLSANVVPQPNQKPMIITTRSARLEVVGTQFDVDADLATTNLNVAEGIVRLERRSDGQYVDVTAKHRVAVKDDQELSPIPVSQFVNAWETNFETESDHYGKWQAATEDYVASVKAIPLVPSAAPHVTLYLAGVSVDQSDSPPVVVEAGSQFVVKGRLKSDAAVFFGIRVAHRNGEFAGMFRGDLLKSQPVASRSEDGEFTEVYRLENFTIDPAVWDKRERLAQQPDDLILTGVWAFTHTESPSGLELTQVRLIPSSESFEIIP